MSWTVNALRREQLEVFRERALEFVEHCTFAPPYTGGIELRNGEVSSHTDLPSETLLRSAALSARLFVQPKEPTHLPRICSLLHQCTTDQSVRDEIALVRKNFIQNLKNQCHIQVGGLKTHADVLDAVLNGAYFHSDAELRRVAKTLNDGPGLFGKQVFALVLLEIRGAAEALLALVDAALGIEPVWFPGHKQMQLIMAQRGLEGVAVDISDGHLDDDLDETMVCVHVDVQLSRAQINELHMDAIIVLRDALPLRKWYGIQCRSPTGEWAQPVAVSPYPRYP